MPSETIEVIKDSFDGNVYFFNNKVEIYQMYLIVIASIVILLLAYLGIVFLGDKRKKGA